MKDSKKYSGAQGGGEASGAEASIRARAARIRQRMSYAGGAPGSAYIQIAIDGPAGAGKSTVARMVAQKLGYLYIDTGAMYRAITLAVMRAKIAHDDSPAIADLIKKCSLEIKQAPNGTNKIYLNGEDVTTEIRQQAVSNLVSDVANQLSVRKVLVDKQREMSASGAVVLDGRDIGTIVLPDAQLKIYLTASLAVRAQRRLLELEKMNQATSLSELTNAIARRDTKDANNTYGPMRPAQDAIMIDTDDLSIDEVVNKIVDLSRAKIVQGMPS